MLDAHSTRHSLCLFLNLHCRCWLACSAQRRCQCIHGEDTIPLHFDKDERALAETDTWRHPLRSTVTYVSTSALQAPTVVMDAV